MCNDIKVTKKDLAELGELFSGLERTLNSLRIYWGLPERGKPRYALFDDRGVISLLRLQHSEVLRKFPEVKAVLELALSRLPCNSFDKRDC